MRDAGRASAVLQGLTSGCVSLSCLPWFPGFPQMQRPCSPWKSPRTLLVQADPSVASFSGDPGLGPPGRGCAVSFLSLAWTCLGFSVSLTLRPPGPARVHCRQGHTSASTACRTSIPRGLARAEYEGGRCCPPSCPPARLGACPVTTTEQFRTAEVCVFASENRSAGKDSLLSHDCHGLLARFPSTHLNPNCCPCSS